MFNCFHTTGLGAAKCCNVLMDGVHANVTFHSTVLQSVQDWREAIWQLYRAKKILFYIFIQMSLILLRVFW